MSESSTIKALRQINKSLTKQRNYSDEYYFEQFMMQEKKIESQQELLDEVEEFFNIIIPLAKFSIEHNTKEWVDKNALVEQVESILHKVKDMNNE